MMHVKKTQEYFDKFSDRDIRGLSHLYSQDVRLLDWNIDVSGKEEVLNANASLFDLDFTLEVHTITHSGNKTFNEITITIGDEKFEIMDVITFNENYQITNITAYKR
jgi:ketosteroid isomerase-like protein